MHADHRGRLRLHRKISAQKIEKCPAAPPSIVVLQLQPLQENQRAEHVGVSQRLHAAGFGQLLAKFVDRLLQRFLDLGGVGIVRPRFIDQAGFERPIGLDQRLQPFTRVAIDRPARFHHPRQSVPQPHHHVFLLADEILAHVDVLVGKIGLVDRDRPVPQSRLAQILAIRADNLW